MYSIFESLCTVGSSNNWWLRSANSNNNNNVGYVNNDGNVNNNNYNNNNGVAPDYIQSLDILQNISDYARDSKIRLLSIMIKNVSYYVN